jgi:hypothetical protein
MKTALRGWSTKSKPPLRFSGVFMVAGGVSASPKARKLGKRVEGLFTGSPGLPDADIPIAVLRFGKANLSIDRTDKKHTSIELPN